MTANGPMGPFEGDGTVQLQGAGRSTALQMCSSAHGRRVRLINRVRSLLVAKTIWILVTGVTERQSWHKVATLCDCVEWRSEASGV